MLISCSFSKRQLISFFCVSAVTLFHKWTTENCIIHNRHRWRTDSTNFSKFLGNIWFEHAKVSFFSWFFANFLTIFNFFCEFFQKFVIFLQMEKNESSQNIDNNRALPRYYELASLKIYDEIRDFLSKLNLFFGAREICTKSSIQIAVLPKK